MDQFFELRTNILAVLNNNQLASGSGDGSIKIWDLVKRKELYCLNKDKKTVTCLALLFKINYSIEQIVKNKKSEMSINGLPFDYDIFISYNWGVKQENKEK